MSSDLEQEYSSDGITEEITKDLSNIHDLLVIPRSSAMSFKNLWDDLEFIELVRKVREEKAAMPVTAWGMEGWKEVEFETKKSD